MERIKPVVQVPEDLDHGHRADRRNPGILGPDLGSRPDPDRLSRRPWGLPGGFLGIGDVARSGGSHFDLVPAGAGIEVEVGTGRMRSVPVEAGVVVAAVAAGRASLDEGLIPGCRRRRGSCRLSKGWAGCQCPSPARCCRD